MTKTEAIKKLTAIYEDQTSRDRVGDVEADHSSADDILLAVIGDDKVTAAYNIIRKWYA